MADSIRDIIAAAIEAHCDWGTNAANQAVCHCDHVLDGDPYRSHPGHLADEIATALRSIGLLPPDGGRTLRYDLEFYVNDIRRQLPYLAPGGPREMAGQIAYDLQTLLDAQHTPTEETP